MKDIFKTLEEKKERVSQDKNLKANNLRGLLDIDKNKTEYDRVESFNLTIKWRGEEKFFLIKNDLELAILLLDCYLSDQTFFLFVKFEVDKNNEEFTNSLLKKLQEIIEPFNPESSQYL